MDKLFRRVGRVQGVLHFIFFKFIFSFQQEITIVLGNVLILYLLIEKII